MNALDNIKKEFYLSTEYLTHSVAVTISVVWNFN